MPSHASHLLQPLDLLVFRPLKTHLGQKSDRITRCGASRIRKHEWLKAYHLARPLALRKTNILSGFKAAGLHPYAPSHVLRYFLPEPVSTEIISLTKGMHNLMLAESSPRGPQLHKTNAALRRMLASHRGLTSPAKRYVSKLADVSERMEARLTIVEKEAKEKGVLLAARKRQQTGKRLVIKDQIILSTKEIRDGVKAAEAETAAKKKKNKKGNIPEEPEVIVSGNEN